VTPYVVGTFYEVPCVRARWGDVETDWPVLSGLHEDAELVGFRDWHYHVDPRFVSQSLFVRAWGQVAWHPKKRGAQYRGIRIDHARGDEAVNVVCRRYPLMLYPLEPGMFAREAKKFTRDDHPKVAPRLRRCHRQPMHDIAIANVAGWTERMEAAYKDRPLVKGICPHRGADLSRMVVDRLGCVECPCHGLVFNAATGALVPRAQWLEQLGVSVLPPAPPLSHIRVVPVQP
jgi:Rieske Fe-S protein